MPSRSVGWLVLNCWNRHDPPRLLLNSRLLRALLHLLVLIIDRLVHSRFVDFSCLTFNLMFENFYCYGWIERWTRLYTYRIKPWWLVTPNESNCSWNTAVMYHSCAWNGTAPLVKTTAVLLDSCTDTLVSGHESTYTRYQRYYTRTCTHTHKSISLNGLTERDESVRSRVEWSMKVLYT